MTYNAPAKAEGGWAAVMHETARIHARVRAAKLRAYPSPSRRGALALVACLLAVVACVTSPALAATRGRSPHAGGRSATTRAQSKQASAAFSYDLVTALGSVYNFGGAGWYGDARGRHLAAPITGMAVTPNGHGYWLAGANGSVFPFGNAEFYGSLAGSVLGVGQQIIAIVATEDGKGYWLVDQSGAVTPFGDALPIGGGQPLPPADLRTPIVSAAISPEGTGAWFTDSAGNVYVTGDAQVLGSRAYKQASPITSIAPLASGTGYWMADAAGDVWGFGPVFPGAHGPAHLSGTVVGMIPAQNGDGYWAATSSGQVIDGGDAGARAGVAGQAPVAGVVAIAPAARVAPPPLPFGATGYDINWPQCAGPASPDAAPLPGPPRDLAGSMRYSIAIVGVDGWAVDNYNPCLAAEIAWAKRATYPRSFSLPGGPPYDLYLFLNSPAPTSTIDRSGPGGTCSRLSGAAAQKCLAFNYGYNAAVAAVAYAAEEGAHARIWWLDIENDTCAPGMWNDAGAGEWWSCTLWLNAQTIQGAIDALRALHITPGIYCTHVQWDGITNGYVPTGGVPLIWVAGAFWTTPPYPDSSGYPAAQANTTYCKESQYWFAGGKPAMLQETPGPNNYPFDPDIAC